ncbi:MAG: nitrogenase component 1 [Clostridiaceae bacterium]|nr:nitrogenase component 1 [Clostridiaceae bacterium]
MGNAFIEIKDLYKTFYSKDQNVEVLKGINLEVEKGDIYGIIGFSGAGKSTIVEENLPRQGNLVNLFGFVPYHDPFWAGNLEELTRILSRLGLQVNTFFTQRQGIENIRTSSAAALNIIVNPWLLKGAAQQYEERFGVPSLRIPGLPIGATDTSAFVRAVGDALKLKKELVEQVIKIEEDYVYSYLEQIVGVLSWKRFAVVGDANYAVGLTRFLANDLSFSPVVTIVSDRMYRQEDKARITRQLMELEYVKPPDIVFEADQYEITRALQAHEGITLLLGSTNEREYASRHDIQCNVVSFPITDRLVLNRTYAGYRGGLTLIEDLYDNL